MPRKNKEIEDEPYTPITEAFCRHYHDDLARWMLFVDGENLTIRAQELAREKGICLVEDDYWQGLRGCRSERDLFNPDSNLR